MVKVSKKKEGEQTVLSMKGSPKTYYPHTVTVHYEWAKPELGFVHASMKEFSKPKLNLPTFNFD
jgi:hypothetical protein